MAKRRVWFKNALLGLLLLGLVLAALYFWDKQKTLFPLKHTEVVPTENQLTTAQRQQLMPILKRALGQSFWQVDLLQLQSDLTRLEWVRSVVVTRQWPDTLQVKLHLQTPVARWNRNGLINDAGQVYYPLNLQPYLDLVQLQGQDKDAAEVLKHLVQFQQRLNALGMQIQSLQLKESGVWDIHLVNGQTLVVDRAHAMSRLQRFVQAYPKVEKSSLKVAQGFDLRYSNGFIIQKKTIKDQTEGSKADGN
ncbi:cell division protein FtsQ/DivIB [Galenea microaerophila]